VTRATTTAAIVAGGRATRFGGRDKSRLIVEGRSIIVRQVDVLQRVAAEILIAGGDASRFADLGLPVAADRRPGLGPIGGLEAALGAARGDRVLVVACDLPFLDARLLERLAALAGPDVDGAWVRGPRGVEPLLACYRRQARAAVAGAIDAGRLSLHGLAPVLRMAEIAGDELRAFGAPDRLLANVNSPEDYARVQYPPA
jgi:molybdopterin-guanine dinucleotide biosynthesis protein A